MPRRRSLAAALLAVCVGVTACADDGGDEPGRQVCAADERTVLVAEKLTRLVPSTPFDVGPGEEAWASVVADADFSPSALVPRVASLFVIAADAEPDIGETSSGLPTSDDPVILFEAEGEWRPVTAEPGSYRVWSRRGPEVAIATCPAPPGAD